MTAALRSSLQRATARSRNWQENVDDLLWLPFPYGPDVEYGSTTSACNSSTADCATFIFTQPDDDRLQRVGVIFNELFEPTEKYGKNGYNDYLAAAITSAKMTRRAMSCILI